MLKDEGIKALVIDLDNTLVPWNVANAPDEVKKWLTMMQDSGLKITIFSNNNIHRVSKFAEPLEIPFIHRARKPLTFSFHRVARKMNVSPGELAVVGDQLLTDVLGGNLFGAYTILVVPIVKSDAPVTKFNRFVENRIMESFYRKGKLVRGVTDGNETSM